MQRSVPVLILQVDVGISFQKKLHNIGVAFHRCQMKSGQPLVVLEVDVKPLCQSFFQLLYVIVLSGLPEETMR